MRNKLRLILSAFFGTLVFASFQNFSSVGSHGTGSSTTSSSAGKSCRLSLVGSAASGDLTLKDGERRTIYMYNSVGAQETCDKWSGEVLCKDGKIIPPATSDNGNVAVAIDDNGNYIQCLTNGSCGGNYGSIHKANTNQYWASCQVNKTSSCALPNSKNKAGQGQHVKLFDTTSAGNCANHMSVAVCQNGWLGPDSFGYDYSSCRKQKEDSASDDLGELFTPAELAAQNAKYAVPKVQPPPPPPPKAAVKAAVAPVVVAPAAVVVGGPVGAAASTTYTCSDQACSQVIAHAPASPADSLPGIGGGSATAPVTHVAANSGDEITDSEGFIGEWRTDPKTGVTTFTGADNGSMEGRIIQFNSGGLIYDNAQDD